MDIQSIQRHMREHDLDGWLLADFHGRNDIAVDMLGITGMLTRRSFYFIPAEGEPTMLVNPIERAKFEHVPGRLVSYFGYKALERELASLLAGAKRIAMEYSPYGRLPYVGLVDAGTIEYVRSLKIDIVSSADMVAAFQACLSQAQVAMHRDAARQVVEVKCLAHELISSALKEGRSVCEYDVTQFILDQFEKRGMMTDHPPNCSVDAHAGDPHYEPSANGSAEIRRGSLVLIDLWARSKANDGVYADITWMAYAGVAADIPDKYKELFAVLTKARDTAVEYLKVHLGTRPVFGSEVDDACRGVINDAGYGQYFTHRTGHSIGGAVHGSGPNIDNLETEDGRQLQPGHLFSIEPGIYMEDCGFRTEINVLVTEGGCEIATMPLQYDIVPLL